MDTSSPLAEVPLVLGCGDSHFRELTVIVTTCHTVRDTYGVRREWKLNNDVLERVRRAIEHLFEEADGHALNEEAIERVVGIEIVEGMYALYDANGDRRILSDNRSDLKRSLLDYLRNPNKPATGPLHSFRFVTRTSLQDHLPDLRDLL